MASQVQPSGGDGVLQESVQRSGAKLLGGRSCNHTFDVHLFWPRQEKRSGSSLLPHTRRNARFRRSPAGIELSAGAIDVDSCVIRA